MSLNCIVAVQCGLEQGQIFKLSMPEGSIVFDMLTHVLRKPDRVGGAEKLADRFECVDVKVPDEEVDMLGLIGEPVMHGRLYQVELSLLAQPEPAAQQPQCSGSGVVEEEGKTGALYPDLSQLKEQVGNCTAQMVFRLKLPLYFRKTVDLTRRPWAA